MNTISADALRDTAQSPADPAPDTERSEAGPAPADFEERLVAHIQRIRGELDVRALATITVQPSDTLTLSSTAPDFRSVHRDVKIQSLDQVRRLIGISDANWTNFTAVKPSPPPAEVFGTGDLESANHVVRLRACAAAQDLLVRVVLRGEHVDGPSTVLLERYLAIVNRPVRLALVKDIIVLHGATLIVPEETHGLYARKIRLHSGSRIVCRGALTIMCQAIVGDYAAGRQSPNIVAKGADGVIGPHATSGRSGTGGGTGSDARASWIVEMAAADGGDGGQGEDGARGGAGGSGGAGRELLILVSDFMAGVAIDLSGGAGGRGGDGGCGGSGGKAGLGGKGTSLRVGGRHGMPGDGGRGGHGGPGGTGGRGGHAVVAAQRISAGLFRASAVGGAGGQGGVGGVGGGAGLSATNDAPSGAQSGAPGRAGADGRRGDDGAIIVVTSLAKETTIVGRPTV